MTRRKRTPPPSEPRKRTAFEIPRSLQQLSQISRTLAAQTETDLGKEKEREKDHDLGDAVIIERNPTDTSSNPDRVGRVNPNLSTNNTGVISVLPRSKKIKWVSQKQTFPQEQQWLQPTPRKPPRPSGSGLPGIPPPTTAPPPPSQPLQTPPTPQNVSIPPSNEPILRPGETLCLSTHPGQIAALIAKKRAENEANQNRERWAREQAEKKKSQPPPIPQPLRPSRTPQSQRPPQTPRTPLTQSTPQASIPVETPGNQLLTELESEAQRSTEKQTNTTDATRTSSPHRFTTTVSSIEQRVRQNDTSANANDDQNMTMTHQDDVDSLFSSPSPPAIFGEPSSSRHDSLAQGPQETSRIISPTTQQSLSPRSLEITRNVQPVLPPLFSNKPLRPPSKPVNNRSPARNTNNNTTNRNGRVTITPQKLTQTPPTNPARPSTATTTPSVTKQSPVPRPSTSSPNVLTRPPVLTSIQSASAIPTLGSSSDLNSDLDSSQSSTFALQSRPKANSSIPRQPASSFNYNQTQDMSGQIPSNVLPTSSYQYQPTNSMNNTDAYNTNRHVYQTQQTQIQPQLPARGYFKWDLNAITSFPPAGLPQNWMYAVDDDFTNATTSPNANTTYMNTNNVNTNTNNLNTIPAPAMVLASMRDTPVDRHTASGRNNQSTSASPSNMNQNLNHSRISDSGVFYGTGNGLVPASTIHAMQMQQSRYQVNTNFRMATKEGFTVPKR